MPPNPSRAPATKSDAPKRHTKGLSLNFPILLPTNLQLSQSPGGSAVPSPIESSRSSPRIRAAPSTSPDPATQPQDKSKARGSGEFLTLLAAQERKVLELKEELQRAEADLQILKKQWAAYEANKKRDEVRQVKKLQPMALDDVAGSETPAPEEDVDEERRRKRALVERNHTSHATNGGSGLSRKGSKRIFEGGRHTRTLSLLSPTCVKTSIKPAEDTNPTPNDTAELETEHDQKPSLSRMPTLDGLISGDALPLGFGKTYKDLAAHRRSLPPVAADMLVKQGKHVYDGVREGLWTFFEDIRQATVGDEGINGTAAQQRPVRPNQRRPARKPSVKAGKGTAKDALDASTPRSKEKSFWNEFGLDTPQRTSATSSKPPEKPNGHVQQKSSTDSSNPPSLLPDLNDNDEVEDSWDAWDSPVSNKVSNMAPNDEASNTTSGGLPWPEMQRVTPKLTRTISDLMKEWDSNPNDSTDMNAAREGQTHILDSPHI
ncbi:hypothetical protein G647_03678 [Cladophialophora carrionii CBS 160.54]|uniref:DUF4048 domain-containing protein n=1 Tax=Cladophialophora carrionii CBS 160.54 TaxID=1279043 RepID=V9DBL8_9EURO|nr:uncharacterized protein G647_03678 [Cladophialophora carrionii CBS 160.54]ETI24309.1 hypothetical protein G647_03678 [Cladophialophora carrionii CBS 160.54]